MDKLHRYSLGLRIDNLFIETIESISIASFTAAKDKLPAIQNSLRKLDTIKVLLLVLFETGSIDQPHYLQLSLQLEETGRMLGGWYKRPLGKNTNSLNDSSRES